MVFIPFSPASIPQPPFFIIGILFPYIFVLACLGVVLGYVLERVRGIFMMVGSAAYWAAAFVLIYSSSAAAFWSMFLVLFADVTYAARYVVRRRRGTTASVSLGLRSRLALIFAIALVLVGFVLSLTWGSNAPSSFTLLQGCSVALVIWVLLADGDKPLGIVRFVAEGFVVSFTLTFLLWFVEAWFSFSWVLGWVLLVLGQSFVSRVLPLSLLPVAISVTAYGVSKRPLPAWAILLSSWYALIYGVYAAYDVWWLVFIFPYLSSPPYSGGAGPILRDMLLMFLAFVVALIFTGIYIWLRKQKQSPPVQRIVESSSVLRVIHRLTSSRIRRCVAVKSEGDDNILTGDDVAVPV